MGREWEGQKASKLEGQDKDSFISDEKER